MNGISLQYDFAVHNEVKLLLDASYLQAELTEWIKEYVCHM